MHFQGIKTFDFFHMNFFSNKDFIQDFFINKSAYNEVFFYFVKHDKHILRLIYPKENVAN